MPAFLTLDSVAVATPTGRPLFSGLSLAVGCEKIGVVGRNGAGKSSLLRVIAGDIPPQKGAIHLHGSIGVLRQRVEPGMETVGEALGVADALDRLDRIQSGAGDEADFAEANWGMPQKVELALAAAGLPPLARDRWLATCSGGERTRLAIAGLLINPPDLLLLDEPTNNLDRDGRNAIATFLAAWKGGALVVSHDRELLENVDRIVSLSPTGVAVHTGGWSSWVDARDATRTRAEDELERARRHARAGARQAQEERERKLRRDRAGRAFAASGSAPKILLGRQCERAENSSGRGNLLARQRASALEETLNAARAQVEVIAPLSVELPPCGLPSNRHVLSFSGVTMRFGEQSLFRNLSFELRGPERVAVSGRNGAGKSTLLRLAAGLIEPQTGAIERSVPSALLDQTVGQLDRAASLLANMLCLNRELDENAARAALARFAFRNVEADKAVQDLSGGECLRAGLACVLSAKPVPQLLLLDEPTNHLDLESIEVIERALSSYDGAVLVVSHDPRFLEAIGVDRHISL